MSLVLEREGGGGWVIRKAETGKAIPDDVLTKRTEARIIASSG